MTATPRRWIGRWIIGVGLVHVVFGFLFYADAWQAILADGVIASVDDFSLRTTAYWFTAAAPLMMILGSLIDDYEAAGRPLPRFLAPALALTLVALLLLMPVNGGWLLVVPVVAMFVRGRNIPRSG